MNWLDPFGEFKDAPASDPLWEHLYKILAVIIAMATTGIMAALPEAYPLAILGGLAVLVLTHI